MKGPDHKVSLLPEELRRLAAFARSHVSNGISLQVHNFKEKREILQGELLNRQVFRKAFSLIPLLKQER